MKTCPKCLTKVEDDYNFCHHCGFKLAFYEEKKIDVSKKEYVVEDSTLYLGEDKKSKRKQPSTAVKKPLTSKEYKKRVRKHMRLSLLGALVLSLIGVGIYILAYRQPLFKILCGLLMIFIVAYGYNLFGKKQLSSFRFSSLRMLFICLAFSVVMLFVAEYITIAIRVVPAYALRGKTITFWDALLVIPTHLTDSNIVPLMIQELMYVYFGTVISFFFNLLSLKKVGS